MVCSTVRDALAVIRWPRHGIDRHTDDTTASSKHDARGVPLVRAGTRDDPAHPVQRPHWTEWLRKVEPHRGALGDACGTARSSVTDPAWGRRPRLALEGRAERQ